MSNTAQTAADTVGGVAAKVGPPATVSIASVAGMQVSELVLWATLIYTSLMIGHKIWQIIKEVRGARGGLDTIGAGQRKHTFRED